MEEGQHGGGDSVRIRLHQLPWIYFRKVTWKSHFEELAYNFQADFTANLCCIYGTFHCVGDLILLFESSPKPDQNQHCQHQWKPIG